MLNYNIFSIKNNRHSNKKLSSSVLFLASAAYVTRFSHSWCVAVSFALGSGLRNNKNTALFSMVSNVTPKAFRSFKELSYICVGILKLMVSLYSEVGKSIML